MNNAIKNTASGLIAALSLATAVEAAPGKIDGSYIRAIDKEDDKRMFIEAIFRATNSIDLPLIAEMVETEGELSVLKEWGIYGAMGRLVGAPAPWTTE